jgi:prepilin-type N-terminal cleavage/methylation domain-containing protein
MRRPSHGFTLIEIAVAMAILGVGVVTLQQIYQGALRLQDRASRQGRAVLHARAAMDSLLAPRTIADTTSEQTTREGFKTRILVRHATAADAPMLQGSVGGADDDSEDGRTFGLESEQSLRYLEVEVSWSDGTGQKSYTLKSLRLASEEEEE